MRNDVDIKIHY